MAYKLKKAEFETGITFDQSSRFANVYSTEPAMIEKLLTLANERTDVRIVRRDAYGIEVELPKKWCKVSPPRIFSEEEREVSRQRMIEINKAAKSAK